MRIAALAAVMVFLVLPAFAQDASSTWNGHNFGSRTCSQPVPCPGNIDMTMPSSADLAANAGQCVSQYFGVVNGADAFIESAGLDTDNCLVTDTSRPNTKLLPHCCIVKLDESKCAFHCDLIQVR